MPTRFLPKQTPDHNFWMFEACRLAEESIGLAHPNPRVGAVVVKNGRLIGRGFHAYDRRDHAEIVALRMAGLSARGSTLYVTLEPCCHTGRTGPCTDAIVAAGVKDVFAAMEDPNPVIAGRGFAKLRHAGVGVHVGSHEEFARELNEDFTKWIRTGLPFVTLKSALTLDGQIAARPGANTAITSRVSLEMVQRLRHSADALLTGIGTILADNPCLTDRTRLPRRKKLLRVILDTKLRLPLRSRIVESADDDVLVFTAQSAGSSKAAALKRAGVELVRVPLERDRLDLKALMRELGRREILNVLLEAGADLNGTALKAGIVDKMVLIYAPRIMGTGGVPLANISAARWFSKSPALKNMSVDIYGPDVVMEGYFRDVYRHHRAGRKN